MTITTGDDASLTAPATRTAAVSAIRALEALGIDTVFGIPGVHTLALYDALTSSSTVRHVLTRHEQGAGFMADGFARATGKPGVALVITGPGLTNVATAIGQAYTDSSPVVVISTNVEREYLDGMRGSLHDLTDQPKLMSTLTKWNTRVMAPDQVGPAIREAVLRAMDGRRLPVHVEIPKDVLDLAVSEIVNESEPSLPEFSVANDLFDEAASALREAKRPLIYAGGGVIAANASDELQILAERLGAPVVTSIQGKGSLPEDHPLSLGALWSPGNVVDNLVREADCLLVVGSKLGVQSTEHFQLPYPDTFIRIDIDAAELTRNATPSIRIVGDAREALAGILDRLGEPAATWQPGRAAAVRSEAEATAFGADRVEWIRALRRAVPPDGVVAWDMTMMSYVAGGLYPVLRPRTFLFPHGFGTLGFAFPAALGAKIGRPDAKVACVVGDGGFQFTMQELATAVQERIGVPVVIFNDSTYSAVKDEQQRSRDGNFIAVDLVNPDYVKLAAAYDIPGVRVSSPETLESALAEAFARDLPTIIDVPIPGWV